MHVVNDLQMHSMAMQKAGVPQRTRAVQLQVLPDSQKRKGRYTKEKAQAELATNAYNAEVYDI